MADSQTNGAQPSPTDGEAALQQRYAAVRARLQAAEQACRRAPGSAALLAVSKTFPAEDVVALARLGQRAFGENYVQEGVDKIQRVRALMPAPADNAPGEGRLQWHFIGPLQSNKTRQVAESFDWVHSVERDRIAQRLNDQRPTGLPPLDVCIQVNVSGEASKSGCAPHEAPALAQRIAAMPRLRLRGLMAIPEATQDEAAQRAAFARLAGLQEALRADGLALDTLSMGMSADLEAAVAEGATLVRVGTAIFGARARAEPTEKDVRPSP